MLCTSDTQNIQHATVDEFSQLRRPVLCGARLKDIRSLQESIARYGLLSPIIIVKRGPEMIVVDGRKRLSAILRLAFLGRLPLSLVRIPYMIASNVESRRSALMNNRELYEAVAKQARDGRMIDDIATDVHLSRQCIRNILALSRLDPILRDAFFRKLLTLPQALAFAAIPDTYRQLRQLRRLGLFASASDILACENDRQEAPAIAA